MSRARPVVYLAGPITGQSYGTATDWRDYAIGELAKVGIMGFSPMRGKAYLKHAGGPISGDPDAYKHYGLSSSKGIVTRDRYDSTTSDLVLFNLLPAEKTGLVSVGSMIELGWSDAMRIPSIVVMTKENPMWHAMVNEIAGFVVHDLETAVLIAKAVLLPHAVEDASYDTDG